LPELARQLREHLAVDGNAAPLHAREHWNERPLERLVNVAHALGDETRLEHVPQPQRDVGILGGVFGGLLDWHAIEGKLGFSRAGDLVVVDGGVIEVTPRERVEPVVGAAGIEHVGHQHGVVEGGELDAA
jgi:hypothetical protein